LTRFSTLDAIVLVAYLVGTTSLGLWVGGGRRMRRITSSPTRDPVVGRDVLHRRERDERAHLRQHAGPVVRQQARLRRSRFLQVVAGYIIGRFVVAGVLLPRYFPGATSSLRTHCSSSGSVSRHGASRPSSS
jgi:hypothetical protein